MFHWGCSPSGGCYSTKESNFILGGRKMKSIINPVKVKRIFAVTTLTSDNKGSQYVTERNQTMRELEVPPAISGNRRISVFVNPLSQNNADHSSESFGEDDATPIKKTGPFASMNAAAAEVLRTARRFKKPQLNKGSTGSLDESLFQLEDSTANGTSAKAIEKDSKSEYEQKINGEAPSSSLDSITNSLASSSPEILAANKANLVIYF